MGGPPAYIFVVRHGNRLDAADKRWHITSPTPYDPPLTYGGFLQARQVGNQIASVLEQAKIEHEVCSNSKKRRKFKVVIHTSPFLRCVQTSIAIASGLAQTPPESPHHPSDVFVSATGPYNQPDHFRSAILRLDSFLGEWLSPEYFEMITPPPGAALMVGSAKADLLRREDYSTLTPNHNFTQATSSGSLWNGSPGASPAISAMQGSTASSEKDGSVGGSAMAAALSGQLATSLAQKKGYAIPKPNYAISNSGKIPDGFVAHARDECLVVDYQWDSMRPPLDFGDGGQFGEEWTSMHKRFRRGLQKMIQWYATTEAPDEMVTQAAGGVRHDPTHKASSSEDEEVETVVILVSHGAGCNALIGAITHQPVLMDVGIASITMAVRNEDIKYEDLLSTSKAEDSTSEPHVSPHQLYDIRMSASTDHLRSTTSTPVSARSVSAENALPTSSSARGRGPSLGDGTGPVIGSFVYSEPSIPHVSRSNSASATMGTSIRRSSGSQRPSSRSPAFGSPSLSGDKSPGAGISYGLWAPAPSSLRLMDGPTEESDSEDFDALLPDFDQHRFKTSDPDDDDATPSAGLPVPNPMETNSEPPLFEPQSTAEQSELPPPALPDFAPYSVPSITTTSSGSETPRKQPRGPVLAGPIKIRTSVEPEKPAEEFPRQLGDGLGGLWGVSKPPGEPEILRDLSLSKRRWTTTERAQF